MNEIKSKNIKWHQRDVTREDRAKRFRQKGVVIWFTGLPGSGKSTLALAVEKNLFERGCHTYVLDGDNVRHGLNRDLGFSPEDREENIRRIGEVAALFAHAGLVTMTAFISPYRSDRDNARVLLEEGEFIEVFCKCDLAICEERDPKGLYIKARSGEIAEFTGISAPYEEPLGPELIVNTGEQNLEACTDAVIQYLREKKIIDL
ncbi:adenylyl-sulfate kinase [Thermodesulfobacteriota bacterium]